MTLEVLVLGLCISDYGCSDILKPYYASRPELNQLAKRSKKRAEKLLGAGLTYSTPVILAAATGRGHAELRLAKGWSLGIGGDRTMLNFNWSF